MGKFDGVLLASDFDNTLLYTQDALRSGAPVPPLPEENRRALEYFMAQGGRFAIATGRALAAFLRQAPLVPMNAPGVVCNGAALYDFQQSKYIDTVFLGGEVRQRAQSVLSRFPQAAVEAYHIDNVIHAVQPNQLTYNHERLTLVKTTEASSLLEVPLPLGKLLWEADHDTLLSIAAILQENWGEDYELIFSAESLLEMTAKGANKGGAVVRLAARLGIEPAHVYCAGDQTNDIPMLQTAAQGFAPANCAEAVRKTGATIVGHAKDGAIADIIDILDSKY